MAGQGWAALRRELDERAASGQPARLWLRDDDVVTVTPALERLIELTGIWRVPMVMAVIPAPADASLAARLGELSHVTAAVHGYAHANHAPPGEPAPGLSQINCRLDVIDWRATRGGLPHALLAERLARLIRQSNSSREQPIGILTHHLVHDEE